MSLETNGMTKADLARLAAMRQTENDTLRAQLSDMTKERDEVRAQAGVTTEVLKHALDWAKCDRQSERGEHDCEDLACGWCRRVHRIEDVLSSTTQAATDYTAQLRAPLEAQIAALVALLREGTEVAKPEKRDFRERVSQALFELSGSAASRDASIRAEGRREATAEALAEFDRVFSPISELLLGLKVRDPVRSALLGIRTKLHKTTSPLASTPPSKPSEEKPQPSAPLGKETK